MERRGERYYNDSLFPLVSWHRPGYPGLFHPSERKHTVQKGHLVRGGSKTVTLGSLEGKRGDGEGTRTGGPGIRRARERERKLVVVRGRDISRTCQTLEIGGGSRETLPEIPNSGRYGTLTGYLLYLGRTPREGIKVATNPENLYLKMCPDYKMYRDKD